MNAIPDQTSFEFVRVGVLFLDSRERECKWIEGEVDWDRTICCGMRTVVGRSYCNEHLARAYPKPLRVCEQP